MESQISQQQEKIKELQDTIDNLKKINRQLIERLELNETQAWVTSVGNAEFILQEETLQKQVLIDSLQRENDNLLEQYHEMQQIIEESQKEKDYLEVQFFENDKKNTLVEKELVFLQNCLQALFEKQGRQFQKTF